MTLLSEKEMQQKYKEICEKQGWPKLTANVKGKKIIAEHDAEKNLILDFDDNTSALICSHTDWDRDPEAPTIEIDYETYIFARARLVAKEYWYEHPAVKETFALHKQQQDLRKELADRRLYQQLKEKFEGE